MKTLNKDKLRNYIYCEQVLKDAEREAEKESIALIQKFENKRKHKFRQISKLDVDDVDHDREEDGLLEEIIELEDQLMEVEMKLQDTLFKATSEFQERVKKITEEMKSKTSN